MFPDSAKNRNDAKLARFEVYIRFCDLAARDGLEEAEAIRQAKKEKQRTTPDTEDPYWMKHPELPGKEAC